MYTLLPMIAGAYHGVSLFYFRASSTYFDVDPINPNWRKWASLIQDWGGLGIWGIAFLSQLFSLLGVAGELNMLVWYWIVGILGGMTVLTVGAFYFLAIN